MASRAGERIPRRGRHAVLLMTTRDSRTDSLLALMGAGFPRSVLGIFSVMDWAEDEIRIAIRTHPAAGRLLNGSFWALIPAPVLSSMNIDGSGTPPEPLYRAHAAEILARVAAGPPLTLAPPTAAEKLGALARMSLVGPLGPAAANLYFMLFKRAFPLFVAANPDLHYWSSDEGIFQQERALEEDLDRKLAMPERDRGRP
jgi:hypothetical protein